MTERDRSRRNSARATWKARSPEEQARLKQKSYDAYAAKYPDRVALQEQTRAAIASGALVPQPCDRCRGEARPLYDYDAGRVVGWRCLRCRKAGS